MKKFKSYTFWISLLGAVILLINTLGTTFGFGVDEVAITSIVTAVLGIFVTLGVIKKDKKTGDTESTANNDTKETDKEETNEKQDSPKQDDKTRN